MMHILYIRRLRFKRENHHSYYRPLAITREDPTTFDILLGVGTVTQPDITYRNVRVALDTIQGMDAQYTNISHTIAF